MVLDYLNRIKLIEKAPDLSEGDIARIIQTRPSGTHFFNVVLLNKAIVSAVPSVEFSPEYKAHTLRDIEKELELRYPVIVWIVTTDEAGNDYIHSIVVTGIDTNQNVIHYNDPTYGKKAEQLSQFLAKWEKHGARMVKVQIGRLVRKTLEEWTPQEVA